MYVPEEAELPEVGQMFDEGPEEEGVEADGPLALATGVAAAAGHHLEVVEADLLQPAPPYTHVSGQIIQEES
jgi:hypothetical protein